jgi:hypothetical protein
MIIPADVESGGAIEAGGPEFLDLIASESKNYQLQLGAGIIWSDSICMERYGQGYLGCIAAQQREILDLIAFRKNGEKDPRRRAGVEFFSVLRAVTLTAFTSDIGAKYLGSAGNPCWKEFQGVPGMPEE